MPSGLSLPSLLELLDLFERAHHPVLCSDGQRLRGVPAWDMKTLQHLTPAQIDAWTECIGYAGSYPAPCGDDLVPVDLDEDEATGGLRYRCPATFRRKTLSADAVAVRAVRVAPLLNHVADLLNIPQAARRGIEVPALTEGLWQLGRTRVGGLHVDVWLVRGLAASVEEVYRHFEQPALPDTGVIVSTGAGLLSLMRPIRTYRVIPIRDLLIEQAEHSAGAQMDAGLIHRVLVGVPREPMAESQPVRFDEFQKVLTIATRSVKPWAIKGAVQAAVVKHLVQQYHLGRRWVPAREIRMAVYGPEAAGRSERISEIFKGNTLWQDYIAQDGNGLYGLKLE